MPSCQLLSPAPPDHHLLPPLAGGLTAAFSCLLFIFLFFRRIKNKPTAPPASDKKPPTASPTPSSAAPPPISPLPSASAAAASAPSTAQTSIRATKWPDFGLARFKVEKNHNIVEEFKNNCSWSEFEEINDVHDLGNVDSSPESVIVDFEVSPETMVNDYVMDWEIERAGPSPRFEAVKKLEKKEKKKRGRLDWWMSMDDEKNVKKEKWRSARKNKQVYESTSDDCYSENSCSGIMIYTMIEERNIVEVRSRSGSGDSIDSWLDGISGELRKTQKNSYDISSTPSMRGTICYVAPEYNAAPVNGSPVSEFKRANLLSLARHLARSSKLHDLVDQSIRSLDKGQSLLCVSRGFALLAEITV
ncbi:hypothetical protein DH2020_044326 [Rehmannia glutinosa]|uniref:Uncharacterized protein n=1 Tax=Rehmannia glutinosa TaxID=99300 RepID=A0ABR0UI20_REHGL